MKDSGERIKQKREFLDVYVILFLISIVAAIATWIVPAGLYTRDIVNGRTMVIAGTYAATESSPVGFWGFFNCVPAAWSSSNQIIFMIFMVGAMVKVLESTGMIEKALNKMLLGVKGREEFALIIISVFFSLLGATGTFLSPIVAVVPIGVLAARKMGYDGVVGFMITYVACAAGFSGGWCNIFTTAIAQEIAELPKFSGMLPRILEHIVFLAIAMIFMIRYCRTIKADPSRSLIPNNAPELQVTMPTLEECKMSTPQKLTAIVTILGFVLLVYASLVWNWNTLQLTALFFVMAALGGLAGGLGPNGTAKAFAKGLNNMAYVAILPGMARVITVVLEQGNIIDTIVHYASMPIATVGPVIGSVFLFIFNWFFNFFVSSGSGQALAVMPLMVPIADLTDITRQVAVECYKLGDAISNQLFPTVSTFMACLALIGIPYFKWIKWALPYILLQAAAGTIFIVVLQMMGWN